MNIHTVFSDLNPDANKTEILRATDIHIGLEKLLESKSHNKVHIQHIVKAAVQLLYRISETEVGRQGILAKYNVMRSVYSLCCQSVYLWLIPSNTLFSNDLFFSGSWFSITA